MDKIQITLNKKDEGSLPQLENDVKHTVQGNIDSQEGTLAHEVVHQSTKNRVSIYQFQ